MEVNTEILIKGAGLVGLLSALALSKLDFRVTLEDKSPEALVLDEFNADNIYDLRVSSITPVSVKIFKALGVWEAIQNLRVSSFDAIKVWEDHPEKALIFEGKMINESPLGYIIENKVIKQVLLKALPSYVYEKGNLDVKLIIGSDGAESETRQQAGIECTIKNYHQRALIAHVHTSKPHQRIARQRFLSTGPLGFLPLLDPHLCSIVWSHDENIAKELRLLSDVEFNSALQEAFGSELGELRVITQRLTFPLKMQTAKQYVKSGLVLIGDAAHTIHPLAGYGVNMGFLDVMTLVKILKTAKAEKRDISKLHTLRKYERTRKSENLLMLKVVDSFTLSALGNIRNIGMTITQKSQLLKNIFMRWMSRHGQENTFI